MDVLKPIIASIIDVIGFDGNGYSEEWRREAARRGLDVETRVPEMIKTFSNPASVEMFTKTGVYSLSELEARNEVKWEIYCKKVQIEARVMGRMALNHIIPAALDYKKVLLDNIAGSKEVFPEDYAVVAAFEIETVKKISECVSELQKKVEDMTEARKRANVLENAYAKAMAYHDIAESLFSIRKPLDKLEEMVDNKLWPLPKYRELLFIS